ncbi:MAG: glycosyltransferase family 2 protein, partial [Clostridiales bacterium]|nr:glycosyltransferase family 2 protein [Clostridiales bacterium]
ILMATYHGEKYICRQLDSLLEQTYQDWHLWVQDDGSKDDTVSIVKAYIARYPNKITLVKDNPHPKGAATNFFSLLPYTTREYLFFCDQDDVWKKEKIAETINCFTQQERLHGKGFPMLIHTDLRVVDEQGKEIASSFMQYQGLKPQAASLGQLLCQNNITGCTVAVNRALLTAIGKDRIPEGLLMHDWWLGIGAAALGKVHFLKNQTVDYYQHGTNEVGAQKKHFLKSFLQALKHKEEMKEKIDATYRQARSFYQSYEKVLPLEAKALIKEYGTLPQERKIKRIAKILKRSYKKQGFARVIGQLIYC